MGNRKMYKALYKCRISTIYLFAQAESLEYQNGDFNW